MAQMTSAQEFGAAICDVLGLKRVLRLQLNLGPSNATVVAEVDVSDYGELAKVIRRFELHPEAKPVDAVDADLVRADGHDAA